MGWGEPEAEFHLSGGNEERTPYLLVVWFALSWLMGG